MTVIALTDEILDCTDEIVLPGADVGTLDQACMPTPEQPCGKHERRAEPSQSVAAYANFRAWVSVWL